VIKKSRGAKEVQKSSEGEGEGAIASVAKKAGKGAVQELWK